MANAKFKTPIGTVMYPSVFEKAKNMDGGEGKYEVVLAIGPKGVKTAEWAPIQSEVERLLQDLAKEIKKPVGSLKNPLRDNEERNEKNPDAYPKGGFFLSAKTNFKPSVVDRAKRPITDPEGVWGGQEGRLVVSFYKFNRNGNAGVSVSLDALQITNADKDRIGGGGSALNEFDDLEDSPF